MNFLRWEIPLTIIPECDLTSKRPDFVFDIANGDIGASRHLHKSLMILRSFSSDPALLQKLDDVMAGRTSMREFGASEAFAKLLDGSGFKQAMGRLAAMSAEERERLAGQGRAELEHLRGRKPDGPIASEAGASTDRTPHTRSRKTTQNTPPTGLVHPGTRKPDRDRIVVPDERDEEDLYYQERNRRGWLV